MSCDCENKIKELEGRIEALEKMVAGARGAKKLKAIAESDRETIVANQEAPEPPKIYGSYKEPDLSFVDSVFMLNMFQRHRENLPYALFKYIYFESGISANSTILSPHKTATHPRFLEVRDHANFEKVKTHDVIVEINKIICGVINSHLTKGDVYVKMDMADKKLLADIVCKRFDKKLGSDIIKNYTDAITP